MLKALVLVLVGWSAEALACSCASPPAVFFPRDGSVGVPTNVQFLLGAIGGTFTLFGPGEVVIDSFTPTNVQRMAPRLLLEPNTDYVLHPGAVKFRTGAGPDTTAPTLTDFAFTGYVSPSIGSTPCGREEWIDFQPNASDDSTPTDQLHYDFFFGATPQTVDLSTARLTLGQQQIAQGACSASNFPMAENAQISGALVAIDWAGNRSVRSPIHILKGCGCASGADALSLTTLGLLLLASRRRRSS